jgi:hypothetical protein
MADVDWLRKFRAALNAALPGNSQWDLGDDWIKRSLGACPDDLMKQIVEDNRRGGDIHGRASVIPPPKASQQSEATPQDRSGWRDPVPLRSPGGIEHVDRLVDAADLQDRLERVRQLGEAKALVQAEADLKKQHEEELNKKQQKGPGK